MSPRFRTKKLLISPSIGLLLSKRRKELNLTLSAVEQATHIRLNHLLAIEQGEMQRIHAVYLQGFIRTYSDFLGLDGAEVIRQYHLERQSQLTRSLFRFSPPQLVSPRIVEFTPKRLLLTVFGLSLSAVVFLIGFQLIRFAAVPEITLTSPLERFVSVQDGQVTFVGMVSGQKELLINGQGIITTPEGAFSEQLHFTPGITTVEIVAKGLRGKDNRRLVTVSVPTQAAAKEPAVINN